MPHSVGDHKNIIYALIDPATLRIRYVGLSASGLRRPNEHFKPSAHSGSTRKERWVKKVLASGEKPLIVVLEVFESREELPDAERKWIKVFKDAGLDLTNLSDGGDGNLGFVMSEEQKKKLSNERKGVAPRPKGWKHSEESKRLMAEKARGRKFTEEHKAKITAGMLAVREKLVANARKLWDSKKEATHAS